MFYLFHLLHFALRIFLLLPRIRKFYLEFFPHYFEWRQEKSCMVFGCNFQSKTSGIDSPQKVYRETKAQTRKETNKREVLRKNGSVWFSAVVYWKEFTYSASFFLFICNFQHRNRNHHTWLLETRVAVTLYRDTHLPLLLVIRTKIGKRRNDNLNRF